MRAGFDLRHDSADCAKAIRALLRQPLLDRTAGEVFSVVIEHARCLREWFDAKCGWPVVVDHGRDHVRLRKIAAPHALARPAMTHRSTPRPFERWRYTLFAVTTAALGDFPRQQVSLQDLAHRVGQLTSDDAVLTGYDPERGPDRAALVDVLELLCALGVLRLLDHRGDYERSTRANALYDINERRLTQLMVAPRPPAASTSMAEMHHEDRYGPYQHVDPPDDDDPQHVQASGEQLRLRARHMIMRRLLDDPVLYLADLDYNGRHYLAATVGPITGWLSEAGLRLERRAEGWCAVDPTEETTDVVFPSLTAVVDQASLLLIAAVTESRDGQDPYWIPVSRVESEIARMLADKPTWAKTYRGERGTAQLAERVVDQLESMGIASRRRDGVVVHSLAGRFRNIQLQDTRERTGEGAR